VDRPLPKNVGTVPVLYSGKMDFNKIQESLDDLKTNGSKLVPGYMKPEGIVVSINKTLNKVVFDPEETKWNRSENKVVKTKSGKDYSHLLQPVRLEKLLSREEKYTKEYPSSLKTIVDDYITDLCGDYEELAKSSSDQTECKNWVFGFIKNSFKERNGV
jgi:hypothetical protein